MKAPKNCPVCGDPMLNIFPPAEDLNNTVTKHCNKRLSHNISMHVEGDEVISLTIDINPKTKLQATWTFDSRKFCVWTGTTTRTGTSAIKTWKYLPYFDPDLSDYQKLINKVKTYLVFS